MENIKLVYLNDTPILFFMFTESKLTIKSWAEEDRPREKLQLKGRQTLTDAELLAIIIGSGNAELSAVELSRQILASVNNDLYDLGKKPLDFLLQFKGIGEAKAISITAALELGRRRSLAESKPQEKIVSGKLAFEIMSPVLSDLPHEEFWIICLNRNCRFISKNKISSGGISGTVADTKLIFSVAIKELASSIILCHNHPSGNLNPSEQDIRLTKSLTEAGKLLDIPVLDHIIIAHTNYYSFAENNMCN
ncbi:MAG TPA: DNA repair protein RadC [Chitinophagales bacterium]|nr:DNA repair protein RadC [Chitinophagales bacterium]HNM31570.1 DNA repair protein RadC [Chitinophagales bacterium]